MVRLSDMFINLKCGFFSFESVLDRSRDLAGAETEAGATILTGAETGAGPEPE